MGLVWLEVERVVVTVWAVDLMGFSRVETVLVLGLCWKSFGDGRFLSKEILLNKLVDITIVLLVCKELFLKFEEFRIKFGILFLKVHDLCVEWVFNIGELILHLTDIPLPIFSFINQQFDIPALFFNNIFKDRDFFIFFVGNETVIAQLVNDCVNVRNVVDGEILLVRSLVRLHQVRDAVAGWGNCRRVWTLALLDESKFAEFLLDGLVVRFERLVVCLEWLFVCFKGFVLGFQCLIGSLKGFVLSL